MDGDGARGSDFRILDLEGNQAVDTLFYRADTLDERYSAQDTIRAQGNIYLSAGTPLISNDGNTMLDIVADTCGRHDTLGGACSAESNTVRYALEKSTCTACRDNYLMAVARWGTKQAGTSASAICTQQRELLMNVPVTPEGS